MWASVAHIESWNNTVPLERHNVNSSDLSNTWCCTRLTARGINRSNTLSFFRPTQINEAFQQKGYLCFVRGLRNVSFLDLWVYFVPACSLGWVENPVENIWQDNAKHYCVDLHIYMLAVSYCLPLSCTQTSLYAHNNGGSFILLQPWQERLKPYFKCFYYQGKRQHLIYRQQFAHKRR